MKTQFTHSSFTASRTLASLIYQECETLLERAGQPCFEETPLSSEEMVAKLAAMIENIEQLKTLHAGCDDVARDDIGGLLPHSANSFENTEIHSYLNKCFQIVDKLHPSQYIGLIYNLANHARHLNLAIHAIVSGAPVINVFFEEYGDTVEDLVRLIQTTSELIDKALVFIYTTQGQRHAYS